MLFGNSWYNSYIQFLLPTTTLRSTCVKKGKKSQNKIVKAIKRPLLAKTILNHMNVFPYIIDPKKNFDNFYSTKTINKALFLGLWWPLRLWTLSKTFWVTFINLDYLMCIIWEFFSLLILALFFYVYLPIPPIWELKCNSYT